MVDLPLYRPDPNGLFEFMVSQLQAAEDAGQKAWIIGHIPSGKADISHDQVIFVSTRPEYLADEVLHRVVELLRSNHPEIQGNHCGSVRWT